MSHRSTQEIDRRLAGADPAPGGLLASEGIEDALDGLGVAITSHPRRPANPRRLSWAGRPKRLLLAAAAVLVIGGGAATAATLLSAHTGHYATGWDARAGGPGEELRMGAPNFCQVAFQVSADIPYPAGYGAWRRWVLVAEEGIPRVTREGACASTTQHGAAQVSTGALRGFFAMSAFCAWIYDWRDAVKRGDRAVAAQAARAIDGAPHWPAVTAEDPDPSAGPLHRSRSGLTAVHSLFGWFLPFRAAVLRGDTTTVDGLIASNYGTAGCSYFDPPASSDGGTVNPLDKS